MLAVGDGEVAVTVAGEDRHREDVDRVVLAVKLPSGPASRAPRGPGRRAAGGDVDGDRGAILFTCSPVAGTCDQH